jgi:hypothetical protein
MKHMEKQLIPLCNATPVLLITCNNNKFLSAKNKHQEEMGMKNCKE